ncbi:MAG: DNA cytosine methyltransferase, partial [Planctomycetes bacterium]|nr:DNA cytosine methyltransferase [Planctomycetota bacterium]
MTATLPGLAFRRTARRRAPADQELVVDVFAGAGGATLGIEAALERAVDLRINHAELALRIGQVNHPMSRHLASDVWEVDPVEACGGRPVGLAWFSPDCTHFSRAKGGRPCKQHIRSLAWVVIRWARAVRPRVIILENVPEFQTWGPLDAEGYPVAERAGQTFRQWVGRLRGLGYAVEWRELVAADYGTPTIRRRLFLVARCDGRPVRWPARTHAPRDKAEALGLAPWRAAAECIDWTLPCPSIFERRRPLAEATQRRIAMGLRKFVLEAKEPFIVRTAHGDSGRWGRGDRDLRDPLPTLTATKDFALVQAFLAKHYGGCPGQSAAAPLGAVTAIDHHGLAQVWMQANNTANAPRPAADPLGAVTTGGRQMLVQAFLIKYFSQGGQHGDPRDPLATITAKHRLGLVEVAGVDWQIVDIGLRMLQPAELLKAQFGRLAADFVLV